MRFHIRNFAQRAFIMSTLVVSVEDDAMLANIKAAIEQLRGVVSVTDSEILSPFHRANTIDGSISSFFEIILA